MQSVSVLILWLLPLLPIGGQGTSPLLADPSQAFVLVTPALIQRPLEAPFPGDSGDCIDVASLWDEEDSVEIVYFIAGSSSFLLWGNSGWNDSSVAHPPHNLLRSPSHPVPLRC